MLLRFGAAGAVAVLLAAGPVLAASKTYDLPPFDQVSISSGVSVVIDVGEAQSVVADASTDAILQRLDVRVDGSHLEIGLKWNVLDWVFNPGESKSVTMHISAPSLRGADASAGADVDVHRLSGDTLNLGASSGASLSVDGLAGGYVTLDSSSGANLTIKGSCTNLIANSSSGGNLDAAGLSCAAVNANVSSGGHAEVWATTSINANASSGGGITVHGKPANTNVNVSFGGSIGYAD